MTAPTGAPAALVMQRCGQNRFYKLAVETPEYLRVIELRDKATRTRAEIGPAPTVPLPPTADCVDEWLEAKARIRKYTRDTDDEAKDLDSLITHCDMMIRAQTVNVDPLVTALATKLPSVMAGIEDAVNRLDGAHTPTDALVAGKGDVWHELHTEHVPEWDAFWQAFDWITSEHQLYHHARSQYLFDDELASRARIRNIDSIFPSWREPAPDTAIMGWNSSDPRPWPADRVGQLVWVVTSGAEVWAPTPRQLREQQQPRERPAADTDIDARRTEFAELSGASNQ